MKKKPLLLILMMMMGLNVAFSQNGLQQILIEKYYVSNAVDSSNASTAASNAGYPTGTLPAGTITWRIYADLEPGWGVQSVYGVNGHPLELSTTTTFYNHPSGNTTGGPLPTSSSSILASGTTFLDSYISCGGVATNRFGVVKSEDNSAATPTGGGANLNFSPSGVLANNDTSIGLPLTTADGMYNTVSNPALLALTLLGDIAAESQVALLTDGSVTGNLFASSNCTWGVLGEQVGAFPSGSNRVLIGQFTTKGQFTYKLNLQLRNTTNFQVRNFVYSNPVGNEILFPSLSGVLNCTTVWYADADGDQFGNPSVSVVACTQPAGYVSVAGDCNDSNSTINPNAVEVCNSIDDNCNSLIDASDGTYQAIATPASISGNLSGCLPQADGSTLLSAVSVPGASSYLWTVPSGLTIVSGQGTNSITVSWSGSSIGATISGNVTVSAVNACGASVPTPAAVQLSTAAPVTPGSISGVLRACPGDLITISVAPVARASSYGWTLPAGMTVVSGSGTNVIGVSIVTGFSGGNISVTASNSCGTSPSRTRLVSVNTANTPGLISGPASGLCNLTGIQYSVAPVGNATSFNWTLPSGATISSGQGTNSILINFSSSFGGGQITVNSVNGCGNSGIRSYSVAGAPARPGVINGITTPTCAGQFYTYGVGTVSGASQYLWTVSPGGTVSFPSPLVASGKDARITWGTAIPASQNVQVRTSNSCGTSLTRTAAVNVSSCATRTTGAAFSGWNIYPNPASGRAMVSLESERDEVYNLLVIDAAGRLMESRQINVMSGVNVAELDLSGYASGIYNLMLQGDDFTAQQRLVVE